MADELQALYPFLETNQPPPNRHDQDRILLHSVQEKAADSVAVKRAFFQTSGDRVVAAARAVADVYRGGGRLFTMGNGGSSCDAAHIAVEFMHPVTAGRPALSAINLCADTAMLSAVANDVGFQHVFLRQLTAQARANDALIGLSTSGNSENLMAAFAKAKQLGMVTIGLAGMSGGAMAQGADLDHCLVVPSDSIHRIQECHLAIYHILWDLVHALLADSRGGLRTTA